MACTTHRMAPVGRKLWYVNPHDIPFFSFDLVPITNILTPTTKIILIWESEREWVNDHLNQTKVNGKIIYLHTYHIKTKNGLENFLLGGDGFCGSSCPQNPSKLARRWATLSSTAAATPKTKASWLFPLHSNIHTLRCFA